MFCTTWNSKIFLSVGNCVGGEWQSAEARRQFVTAARPSGVSL